MPLKIRCKGCKKVLNLPDRVRGKAIKCPGCQTVLRVPAATAGAAKGEGRTSAQPSADDDDDVFSGLDLRRAADHRVRVCVKCGAEPEDEEEIDCQVCGHNIDTGVMSEVMRKRRAHRGPDPDEFWSVAWTGSAKFVRNNLPLVWRTATYWVLFLTLTIYCSIWLLGFVIVTGKWEPIIFFTGVLFLFVLGTIGWFWHLSIHVIKHTMNRNRNKPIPKFHFDFFQCIALGLKAVVWPAVLFLPAVLLIYLFILVPAVAFGNTIPGTAFHVIFDVSVRFIALLVFPLAMIHMSMPYSYKAWTPYHMGIALGKNFLPALYFAVIALTAMLPFGITALILQFAWSGGLPQLFVDLYGMTIDLVDAFLNLVGLAPPDDAPVARAWYRFLLDSTLAAIPIALFLTPFCVAGAFGAVFVARANGYVGLYFHDRLDLVRETKAGVPCGFWPRYLAYLIDYTILGVAQVLMFGVFFVLVILVGFFGIDAYVAFLRAKYIAVSIGVPYLYFARPQSSPVSRASLGKAAMGIIVTREDGKTMDFAQSSGRYWVKVILGAVTLNISYLMAAFTKDKRGLHDQICKTIVVWHGDDERNEI